jgi:segregation and condensation protein A
MTDEPDQARGGVAQASMGAPDADAGGYRVELPEFQGPLDLLLHLIQEHELDILDIPIGFVTQKYVEYIILMQELNIDMASEYLVMAATLAHIKSKMLLPTPPQDQEEEPEAELDPRAELVRRLLEYQKYKLAAEQLSERAVLGRDVFVRGIPAPNVDGPAPLAPLGIFKLLDAFQTVLSRAKTTVEHQINFERFSITDRINQLVDVLRARRKLHFEDLFEGQEYRSELIVTFLAILEMTRLRMTRLTQDGPLEPIFIELAVSDEEVDDLARAAAGAIEESEKRTELASPAVESQGEPGSAAESAGEGEDAESETYREFDEHDFDEDAEFPEDSSSWSTEAAPALSASEAELSSGLDAPERAEAGLATGDEPPDTMADSFEAADHLEPEAPLSEDQAAYSALEEAPQMPEARMDADDNPEAPLVNEAPDATQAGEAEAAGEADEVDEALQIGSTERE